MAQHLDPKRSPAPGCLAFFFFVVSIIALITILVKAIYDVVYGHSLFFLLPLVIFWFIILLLSALGIVLANRHERDLFNGER